MFWGKDFCGFGKFWALKARMKIRWKLLLKFQIPHLRKIVLGQQDMSGNPDVERRSETFKEEWVSEAVMRYFYNKLQQRRAELEQAINQQNKRD